MYIDGVILFSLLMILLILVMMGYIGVYFFKHIKMDAKKAKENAAEHADEGVARSPKVKAAL